MAQTLAVPDSAPRPHRWTCAEYLRLGEGGFLGPEPNTELIDGLILRKMPQGNAHILAVKLVFYALQEAFQSGYHLAVQSSLPLGDGSMPEPDVVLLRGAPRDYDGRNPDPACDVAIVVEVSDSTLAFDRAAKTMLYASFGIPEYWIVNVAGRSVEVRCGPRAEDYAEMRVFAEGESILVGGGAVAVADLLPRVEGATGAGG